MGFLDIKDYYVDANSLPKGLHFMNGFWMIVLILILGVTLFLFPIQENLFGKVEIYFEGVPIKIKAKMGGDINLLVEDGSEVNDNELIGFYNWKITESDYKYLDSLAKYYFDSNSPSSLAHLSHLLQNLKSSDIPYLQGEISAIITSLEVYNSITNHESFDLYIESQKRRIESIKKNKLINQSVLESKLNQIDIIKGHISSDSLLLDEGVLSQREYEIRKRNYSKELIELEESTLTLGSADENIQGIQSAIQLGKHEIGLTNLDMYKNLLIAHENYKKVFYSLNQEKRILSPISGIIFYSDVLNFSTNLEVGTEILLVKPNNSNSESIARIITGSKNTGRVKDGNKVLIMLDEFPMDKYGVIYGTVKSRREISENNKYIFDLNLSEGLKTSYDIVLDPQTQLTGKGSILLNRTNIFWLIYNEIIAQREVFLTKG